MDKIIAILNELKSGVDFASAEGIVTNKLIDSIDIGMLISSIEEEFDIEIGMEYMDNENFDTVDAIWNMVQEIQEG